MNYYENKQLQARESHLMGAGISFIIVSPTFGIVAGIFLRSANAMYVTTGISIIRCPRYCWHNQRKGRTKMK
jgi:hypothetical protein